MNLSFVLILTRNFHLSSEGSDSFKSFRLIWLNRSSVTSTVWFFTIQPHNSKHEQQTKLRKEDSNHKNLTNWGKKKQRTENLNKEKNLSCCHWNPISPVWSSLILVFQLLLSLWWKQHPWCQRRGSAMPHPGGAADSWWSRWCVCSKTWSTPYRDKLKLWHLEFRLN